MAGFHINDKGEAGPAAPPSAPIKCSATSIPPAASAAWGTVATLRRPTSLRTRGIFNLTEFDYEKTQVRPKKP